MRAIYFTLFIIFANQQLQAQVSARLFQYPDVSQNQIAFTYGGDIWTVAKDGGIAAKLTTAEGREVFAKFSPDGKTISFSGNYDGNTDIYTIPAQGGIPVRVTHHGMTDQIIDWYPDGQHLLYASSMHSEKQRFNKFFKISVDGGLPTQLPMMQSEFGSLSPDGKKIAFTDKSRVFRTWKRYRGGMSADIYVFDLESFASENITNNSANDELPMWYGNDIYYLSDKGPENRYNIWKYNTTSKEHNQITRFDSYDVHYPSLGNDEIVFEAEGKIYLLDLKSNDTKEVSIQVGTDLTNIKPRKENVSSFLQNMAISPDGKRALVEARGELFSLPAKEGYVQNLTRSSSSAERYPAWSPNGKYIAYWSDKSGEYELTLRDITQGMEEKQLTNLGPGFRYQLFWSPDSKKIAWIDQTMEMQYINIDNKEITSIDKDISLFEGGLRNFSVSWSPDSRWIVYDKTMENGNSAIFIYDTDSKQTHQVTAGFYSDNQAIFDPDGKYLYCTTNRSFKPVYSDFDNSWSYPNATQVALITLQADTPSPFAAENDTVAIATDEEAEDKEDMEKEDQSPEDKAEDEEETEDEKDDEAVVIDFEGFERRMIVLPPHAGNMGRLSAVSGKVLFVRAPNSGSEDEENQLKYFDIEEEEEKTIIENIRFYSLSSDGKKILVRQNSNAGIIDVAAGQKLEDPIALNEMEATIEPLEEWKQIFTDAWRFQRDFFYDKGMHGVDWSGMRQRYGSLIDYCASRYDVNFVIGELIGELNASHTYRGGGDQENADRKNVGYLGIDWTMTDGKYQVEKIIRGAEWDNEVRSPLDMPGINVKESDFILAVNGIALTEFKDPWEAFEGMANKPVELTVNDQSSFEGARKVIVKPLDDETRLRHLAWIESNRKRVDEESDGKIGYIYVPSTGLDGQNELVRQFYGQWNKEGLIIDERFNNGGQIPDRFIELLNRKPLAYWSVRDGKNWQWPPVANFGSMAMLINGWSGSGGDAFPDYFRKAGLGPLIGTRTWGGLIGISGAPSLIDGGMVTVPTFRMYNPDGTWFKEGHGVDPDIEVKEDPTQLAKGIDPQLEASIKQVMEQIAAKGPIHPKEPAKQKRT